MTLSIIVDALGGTRVAKGKVRDIEDMSEVLAAAQKVVDTLTPPKGGRYVVALKDAETASTDYRSHRIVITARPLLDSSLTKGEVAEVITGLTAHEIGHTIYDAHNADAIRAHNPHPAFFKVHNVLADHRLERRMRERFPMIGPAFTATGRWIAKWYRYEKKGAVSADKAMSPVARFNFMIAAIRYPGGVKWSADDLTRAERRRWQRWADQYTADDSLDLHLAGCDVAFEWLKTKETPESQPEAEDDEPEDFDSDEDEDGEDADDDLDGDEDDDLDGDDEDEDGDDLDFEDDEDEDEDEDGESKDEGDDPEDEDGTDEGGWGDGDFPDPNEEQGGEPEPTPGDGSDDEGEDGAKGDGEDADDPHDLPEWDERGTGAPDIHNSVEREYQQHDLANKIERHDAKARVNFGAYGSMVAQWQ